LLRQRVFVVTLRRGLLCEELHFDEKRMIIPDFVDKSENLSWLRSDPRVIDTVTSLIGPRTRAVAISHALWANGRVLPLREIADAARTAGAPLLIDGAQGVGAIDVDPELGRKQVAAIIGFLYLPMTPVTVLV
jgi:dTDP-4-amino-4,6-dideoxygalactose transaminase